MGTLTTTRPVPEDFLPRALHEVLVRHRAGEKPARMAVGAFPVYADDPLRDSHDLIDAYVSQAVVGSGGGTVRPAKFTGGRAILDTPADARAAHARAILARLLFDWEVAVTFVPDGMMDGVDAWRIRENSAAHEALCALATELVKRDMTATDDLLLEWTDGLTTGGRVADDVDTQMPAAALAEIYAKRNGDMPAECVAALRRVRDWRKARRGWGRDEQKLLHRLDELLSETPPERKLIVDAGEPWAEAVLDELRKGGDAAAKWEAMLRHCATGGTGSKPTGKWLKEAKRLIDAIGAADFARVASEWLSLAVQPRRVSLQPHQCHPFRMRFDIYSDRNAPALRGLAWACGAANDPSLTASLGALAEASYKKIPDHGPRAPAVGNACLVSLIALPGPVPRAELSRLKAKVKQPTARKMIEKAIGASAAAAGMTPDDMEELALGAYGLSEVGRGERAVGDYKAELCIAGTTKVDLTFTDAKGKARASVPEALKSDPAVKELQQQAKELAKMLPALRDRLERMPMNRRELPMSAWRARYLDHPVVGTLARRLIWQFAPPGRDGSPVLSGAWLDGRLVDADDKPLPKLDEDKTLVRLWHPARESVEGVRAWRAFLQRHQVTQPFKQAHREVYLLTDAERETRTYSNRFAAHVLRQHQFAALCTQRGWTYRLMGTWDGGGDTTPALTLPRWNLRVEYWLTGGELDEDDDDRHASGVAAYVSTDQVRFYDAEAGGTPMPLDSVPPLAFSEVMRDVDLFVGVTSVGNDPAWQDAGETGLYRDYWHSYSFGELSATAETRREVLESLLPRLKIRDRATLADRFLVVVGQLRTYKIHLGSGNILMEPNDQYLCIVPARGAAKREAGADDVFLPFEGDATLSVILSKAFMLADDTKITDASIVSQIRGK